MSWFDVVVVLIGLALTAAAIVWRRARSRSGTDDLREGLKDPDPSVRVRSLVVIQREGLDRHCAALLDHVRSERDPQVIAAIRALVAHHAWEPTSAPNAETLNELRQWAKGAAAQQPTSADDFTTVVQTVDRLLVDGEDLESLTLASADQEFSLKRSAAERRRRNEMEDRSPRPQGP
jgi:hypothetical protein